MGASEEIDCPRIAEILLAILLFADDIALFSYSHRGSQRQLDILYAFRTNRQLTVNVAKTKALVFEARKNVMPPLIYAGNAIEQVDIFKYLGVQMHGTKGLTPAMEYTYICLVQGSQKGHVWTTATLPAAQDP